MATETLPPSSTTWPSASSRASRPATRTADGPMSTPRRDCPRSSGTPITRIFFGTMLETWEDERVLNHESQTRSAIEMNVFVYNRKGLLRLNVETLLPQLED